MHLSISITLLFASIASSTTSGPRRGDTRIPNKYIVRLKDDITTSATNELKASLSSVPSHHYSMVGFRGFAGTFTAEEVARLQDSHQVKYVEEDSIYQVTSLVKQSNATWGLARISSRVPDTTTYTYDDSAGEGTCAYVLDTGIQVDHPEFEGRATFLTDFSGENSTIDGMGHGTHVAGTIGSKTYGIAKKTKLYAVKVLDKRGRGTNSGIIQGLDYVFSRSDREQNCPKGIVLNMSVGGPKRQSMNDAVKALVNSGIFVAVSAGNELTDAGDSSPASEPSVCTVGATEKNDTFAYFSNYGPSVDILAPGVDVMSTWKNNLTRLDSGTSMASPHIVGIAAYLLGLGATAELLCETIQRYATKDLVLVLPDNTPNLLAYNGASDLDRPKYGDY